MTWGPTWKKAFENMEAVVIQSDLSGEVAVYSKRWRDTPAHLDYVGRWEDLYPFYAAYCVGRGLEPVKPGGEP